MINRLKSYAVSILGNSTFHFKKLILSKVLQMRPPPTLIDLKSTETICSQAIRVERFISCFANTFGIMLTLWVSIPQNGQTHSIRRQQPTNCLSVFHHFMGLARKGLISTLSGDICIQFCISLVFIFFSR